jgi:DNA-binding beta-propeller fold protein YncE
VAVARHNNLVYVLNSDGAGSVVGFQLGFGGHLTQIKDATSFLTANVTGGASLAMSPDGHFLAVTEHLANNIDVFQIQSNGLLAPIVFNPSPDPGAFSVTFAPNGSAIVSETGPADANDGSAISSYSILSTGKLASISQGIPTLGAANCWNIVTPDETKVYISNAGSSTISGFVIGPKGTLTRLPGTVVGENSAGATNLDIAVSADGKYLYTQNSGAGTIGSFAFNKMVPSPTSVKPCLFEPLSARYRTPTDRDYRKFPNEGQSVLSSGPVRQSTSRARPGSHRYLRERLSVRRQCQIKTRLNPSLPLVLGTAERETALPLLVNSRDLIAQ